MADFKNNPRILFIPGFLDGGALHGFKYYLDIWHTTSAWNKDLGAEMIIAHSLGALAALEAWQYNRGAKLILVNPVFSSRNIFRRWLNFNLSEGMSLSWRRLVIFTCFFSALRKALRLSHLDYQKIIDGIDAGQLIIIYGEQDKYLVDRKIITALAEKGIAVREIKNVGHNYGPAFDREIANLILNNKF